MLVDAIWGEFGGSEGRLFGWSSKRVFQRWLPVGGLRGVRWVEISTVT